MACEPGRGDSISPSGTVAFTAKLKVDDSYPSYAGTLKFTNLLVNEGGGYCPKTGVFTCPVDGFYYFAVHMSVYGRGQGDMSEGDMVWVNLWGHGRHEIIAAEDNVFVGFHLGQLRQIEVLEIFLKGV